MTEGNDSAAYVYAKLIEARAKAVECMAWLKVNDKEYSDADMAARALNSDMERMMHNRFEV